MKTTPKTLLLLGLCTLFGFLVYVDFMGGVRGDEEKKLSQSALKHSAKAGNRSVTENQLIREAVTKEAVIRGISQEDKAIIYKLRPLIQELLRIEEKVKHGETSPDKVPTLLNEIIEKANSIHKAFQKDVEKYEPTLWATDKVSGELGGELTKREVLYRIRRLDQMLTLQFAEALRRQYCGFTDNSCQLVDFMSFDKPFDVQLLKRYPSATHRTSYPIEYSVEYEGYTLLNKVEKAYAKIRVEGNFARVTLAYVPEAIRKVQGKAPEKVTRSSHNLRAFYVNLPVYYQRVTSFSQAVLSRELREERKFSIEQQQKRVENLKEEIKNKLDEKESDNVLLQHSKLVSVNDIERYVGKSYHRVKDTMSQLVQRHGCYSTDYEWLTDNSFRIEGGENDLLHDKLITYDLPLTPTPEGYVLDWPFPTDLYPLELELEVFPAPRQQLVIAKDFKGEDLPQNGKRFFWKKFPSKNLHLELKGNTTVVLQSEAQENEEPAFSLIARADLPQEKAAPQHTAFLLDASERTKAQRFGEYAALLLQLLEKEEKHIPKFSLFYFQTEAQAYGKALPNTPTERQKLRRFLQSLKPQGAGTLEKALPIFANFAPEGSRALLLAAGNIHHGDVHEIADSLGSQSVKIHPNSPMAHAAPLLAKGLRCYTLEDGIAEQHHPLLNYIAHASGGQRLQFHGLKDAENVMQKLLSQPWEIEKIEVEGAKDLLFSKQIRALLPGQHFQLNGQGQWPGTAKIHLRSTEGRRKTLAFEAETLSSPLPPREHARALLKVYAAKGNTPETRFHEATLRKKYNIAGRFFRFSNQLEEAYASPYTLLKDFDPNWQESTLEKEATLQNYTDAFPNYSPRRMLFAALNRYAIAHEKAFSPEEKELFLNLPESAFEKREIAQWVARFEKATPTEGDVEELREALVKP